MAPGGFPYEVLSKVNMAAGCLFFDRQGRVLLVKPTYKPTWEIPGGMVEQDESPWQCCRREVQEELGLARAIGGLLVVDYDPPSSEKSESLKFVFSGGVLDADEIAAIHLPAHELSEWRFFEPDALPQELTATLRKRVLAAWRQAESQEGGIYLESQRQPGAASD